jgi:hypothetical protein
VDIDEETRRRQLAAALEQHLAALKAASTSSVSAG